MLMIFMNVYEVLWIFMNKELKKEKCAFFQNEKNGPDRPEN